MTNRSGFRRKNVIRKRVFNKKIKNSHIYIYSFYCLLPLKVLFHSLFEKWLMIMIFESFYTLLTLTCALIPLFRQWLRFLIIFISFMGRLQNIQKIYCFIEVRFLIWIENLECMIASIISNIDEPWGICRYC